MMASTIPIDFSGNLKIDKSHSHTYTDQQPGKTQLSSNPPPPPLKSIVREMSDFGIFENQPAHLLSDVLERVPYNDLNSLALSSKFWHPIIKKHVESPRFKKDILQSKNTFDIGKLIATMSEPNDFQMIQQFLENRWENEKGYDGLGDAIRGFCINSEGEMRKNIEKLFHFTWNLVEHLDELLKKVNEEFDIEEGVDELNGMIAGRRRMELRRQLHSLFWKGDNSEYKGFNYAQFFEKIRDHVEATLEKIYKFLQVLLNPTRIIDGEEFIRKDFLYEDDMLVPFAEAFKALQSAWSTKKENNFYADFVHFILRCFFLTEQISAIFALEPSLLMWFLLDFSYVSKKSYFVAEYLLKMTMTMRGGNYGSLEDLKSAFVDLKNHVYNRFDGYFHLTKLHNEIESAKMRYCTEEGVQPIVFDNEYTKCLDILSLGTKKKSKKFSSLES
ncbi:unnamed protein product [Caenorhabditis brenneri]